MKMLFYSVLYPLIRPLYLVSVIVNTLVLGIIVILVSLFDTRGTIVHYIGKFWSLLNIHLSGTRVRITGTDKIDRHRPYIVMSNHQSLFDVWALIGKLPLQIRWIVKKELRKIPVFGYALERMGHIYIDRSDRTNAYAGLNEAARRVKEGTSVIIFPEGTRSKDGRLLRFRPGGAVIALRSGVSILPVTVNGGRFVLRKGTLDLLPGKMEIIIGNEIDPAAFSEDDRDGLMKTVKSAIEKNLDLSYGEIPQDK
jgi:1-acyl-sn-glycerol-3-phosphate acyltransferase